MEINNHDLKVLPKYFNSLMWGAKPFEVRKNDRDFKVGDLLTLREWEPEEKYSGRVLCRQVGYVLKGGVFGIPEDLIIMSLIMV